ncbi:uncharacterized protein E6C27_scaffold430G00850 [Cucumis melo var. makuwa]|uniref:Serine/threonine-protein kinase nek2 n=2 Tax=Cucumis melo var. makuwa TaxID=1194695 RepID=A0A5A7UZZ5_CUCMM|nr:uncharacterized protein E6C27_scaffold430G00850 [Cucumis melo var. makuwa]
MIEVAHEEYSKDPNGFKKLPIDAEKPLYEGCKKYTKLSTLVKLYNLKVRYGWSDISFSKLHKTLKEILPTTNELPNSLYEAKKTLGALGMEYEKIHACPNNCCLYRKEFANATECPECGQSRWKNVKDRNEERKQIPSTVIWYFPPIPRFKRLFRSIECAENLTWHASERIEDGKLRRPVDSPAWKLKSFIGSATHYHVPITYMSWKSVPAELKDKIFTIVEAAFVIDPRSRKNVLQTAGISFCQFKNWLTTKYIIPHKDEPQLLQVPPEKYSFIEQNHWEEFVRSRLLETFQEKRKLQQDRRSKNKYNHRISRKGYANLKEEMKEGSNEVYVDRAKMWKKARVNKQGQYDNDDIQQVVHKIDEISMNTDSSSVNRHCSNDVLTQALGTKEHNGRVRGVGGYVTPTTRVSELEAQIRSNLSIPLSAHGSCLRPMVLEGIKEKGKRIEVESLDKPKQKEKKGKEVMKMNEPELDVLKERDLIKMPTEKEVVCESTSTLPLALKLILRYVEKVMEKDSSITFSLPDDLFGVSRKTSVLREDIVDLCNMNEVKTFTLVAYMMGHWALLAINAYEDTMFYLVSLRTTSKATTRYVTDM